jgi:predicted dehydrogenase
MRKKSKVRVGIVGCGNISKAYFEGLSLFPDLLEVVACADLDEKRAQAVATERHVPKAGSVASVLKDPAIDLIVNLTVPQAHAAINVAALQAGKHAYCEKPFSVNTREGKKVLALAKKKKLLVGTAPDTFLGSGYQTCRHLIDTGVIGRPIAATAFMTCHGHERWHSSPAFYYQKGGGPLFDMGPYYLTALVHLMGPIQRVSASTRMTFPTRTITSQPLYGQKIKVETATHIAGTVDFANGAVATIIMSFDIWAAKLPRLEIYGTQGSLSCPDPNQFHVEDSIYLQRAEQKEWESVPLLHPHRVGRGMGVADMAKAIQQRRAQRCSGELGYHLVEVMEAFEASSRSGRRIKIKSTCRQPKALPPTLGTGEMD